MAEYRALVPFVRKWEGGWSHDPSDPGGATMCGVTMVTYTLYRQAKGAPKPTISDLRALTDEEWMEIFKTYFWDACRGDEIRSQRVAEALVDWYWCSGTVAMRKVQELLGVEVDGIVGAVTLSAINEQGGGLSTEIHQSRKKFLVNLCHRNPALQKYRRGWLRRVEALEKRWGGVR